MEKNDVQVLTVEQQKLMYKNAESEIKSILEELLVDSKEELKNKYMCRLNNSLDTIKMFISYK